jgi:cytohesin
MFSFIKKFFKGTLHKACDKGNIEAVKQHLADGADVNAKDDCGSTPLLLAALGGHKVIAELLIAKGADVNAKMEWAEVDSSEITAVQTPLDCAVDHPEIAALLRKHGSKTGEELKPAEPVAEASQPEPSTAKAPDISIHKAAERGNIEAVKQHLAAGTDVNAKNYQGMTPLHKAARSGRKETAELLIDKDADLNAKSDSRKTTLDWAIIGGKNELADLLRKHGGKTWKELKAEGK